MWDCEYLSVQILPEYLYLQIPCLWVIILTVDIFAQKQEALMHDGHMGIT